MHSVHHTNSQMSNSQADRGRERFLLEVELFREKKFPCLTGRQLCMLGLYGESLVYPVQHVTSVGAVVSPGVMFNIFVLCHVPGVPVASYPPRVTKYLSADD